MNVSRLSRVLLVASSVLSCGSVAAQVASSGAGAMRCTVVIGKLSSQKQDERMMVLAWVQGYLTGAAASRSALPAAGGWGDVPEYDALAPRVLMLCKAQPTMDLRHVATQFFDSPPQRR